MIDRYSITCSSEKLHERFGVDVPDFYKAHYNAAPTQLLPVITHTSPNGVSLFYWGISPEWAKNKNVSEKVINIKAELLIEKHSLRKAIFRKRCIIPADGFYGWKKVGKKTLIPHRFTLVNQSPFAIAGVWEDFEDERGEESHTFIMFTLVATSEVSGVTDRMPLILTQAQEKIWLSADVDDATLVEVLNSKGMSGLSAYTVSPRIHATTLDVPSLIIPAPPADQHGNLTLFD